MLKSCHLAHPLVHTADKQWYALIGTTFLPGITGNGPLKSVLHVLSVYTEFIHQCVAKMVILRLLSERLSTASYLSQGRGLARETTPFAQLTSLVSQVLLFDSLTPGTRYRFNRICKRRWDDPRLLTLAGLRRRGAPAVALNAFCHGVGITRNENVIPMHVLEYYIRCDPPLVWSAGWVVIFSENTCTWTPWHCAQGIRNNDDV